jgi:hypothetical protein
LIGRFLQSWRLTVFEHYKNIIGGAGFVAHGGAPSTGDGGGHVKGEGVVWYGIRAETRLRA